MKQKFFQVLLGLMLILFVAGCGSSKEPTVDNNPGGNTANTQTSTPTVTPVPQAELKNYKAVYTGEAVNEASFKNIPFLAVIENMKVARPQSGLSQADIVYETLAEGGIPRFIALFQSQRPKEIGPIRSDRVYFNEIAKSMDLPFAHCGGSQASIDQIYQEKLMSMNQMYNGKYFWRSKSKRAPHNLFTSSEKLEQFIMNKGYVKTPEFNIAFDNSYWEGVPNKALSVNLKMSGYYSTAYKFENGIYYKTMGNVSIKDKNNGEPLKAKNIVVQIVKIRPIANDPKHRVEISMTGSGKGYVFSNGSYIKINWSKKTSSSMVELTDENNNPIKLSEGNTWWEILDGSSKITIGEPLKK